MVLNEGLEKIGDRAFQYAGFRSVNLPLTIKFLGQDVFSNCENLENHVPQTLLSPDEPQR